jgi:hypothetical protein
LASPEFLGGPQIVTFCGKVNSRSRGQPVVAFCLTCFEPSIGSVILVTPKVSLKSSGLEAILPLFETSPPAEMKRNVIMNGRIQHLNLDYVLCVPIYVIDVTVPRQNASGANSPCSICPKQHVVFFDSPLALTTPFAVDTLTFIQLRKSINNNAMS